MVNGLRVERDYWVAKKKLIVDGLYSGREDLPLAERERILLCNLPKAQRTSHATYVDEFGRGRTIEVTREQEVALLEVEFLELRGILPGRLC